MPDYFIRINHELFHPAWKIENGRRIFDLTPVCCFDCAHYVCLRLNTSAFTDLSKKCGEFILKGDGMTEELKVIPFADKDPGAEYAELQDFVARELDNYLGYEEDLCPDEHLARALWLAGYRKVENGN